eukprot:2042497-Ditylum_brightwellii.AAC.2
MAMVLVFWSNLLQLLLLLCLHCILLLCFLHIVLFCVAIAVVSKIRDMGGYVLIPSFVFYNKKGWWCGIWLGVNGMESCITGWDKRLRMVRNVTKWDGCARKQSFLMNSELGRILN